MKTHYSITAIASLLFTMAISILATSCSADGAPEAGEPGFDADGIELQISIPDLKPAWQTGEEPEPTTRLTKPDANGAQQWEDGDVIYLQVRITAGVPSTHLLTAVRSGGKWHFSKTISLPLDAWNINITAYYTGIHQPGQDYYYTDEFLYNDTFVLFTTNQPPTAAIELGSFDHWVSCIRFTGLAQGDRVWFNDTFNWLKIQLLEDYDYNITNFSNTDFIMADATGTAVLYTMVQNESIYGACQFAITDGTVTTRPDTDQATWYTFHPGTANEDGGYNNRRYEVPNPGPTPGSGGGLGNEDQW
ncbi:hypothetical protein [Bacteroides sp. 51]|uniref:hypothetical protein n=1 Tax=Bacteroides sp. 51 TaxID=2302938 RepID=UPI0013D4979A|nr:hypothetical protein [Bacteroides sp. 51]NDV82055.1 hypothetical protein [Bacteroides sp. 51]